MGVESEKSRERVKYVLERVGETMLSFRVRQWACNKTSI